LLHPLWCGRLVFTLYPLAGTVFLSFTHFNGSDPPRWNNFLDYTPMLQDDTYQQSLFNMA
jgi:multiple sugar transport system permease protein